VAGDDGDRTRDVAGIDETTEHVSHAGQPLRRQATGGHAPLLILSVTSTRANRRMDTGSDDNRSATCQVDWTSSLDRRGGPRLANRMVAGHQDVGSARGWAKLNCMVAQVRRSSELLLSLSC
jgi:hypothetical protein